MELFAIRNLTFAYPEQDSPVLRQISLTLEPGDFAVIAGSSGCGKTTLLRQLKTVLAPHGTREGEILFRGTRLDKIDSRTQASKIGFVMQDPDSQIVTDKVWHELAFGLENLGVENAEIRAKVAEMASFFGIQTWFHKEVNQLSGGQKQLLNLASVMVLQPDILILDEPTAQLDPIAAADFLQTLGRINRELGTTVLICEHRLEEIIPSANRLIIMDDGQIIADSPPQDTFAFLKEAQHPMMLAMPTPMRVWNALETGGECPLTVSDGRNLLTRWAQSHTLNAVPQRPPFAPTDKPCLQAEGLWFRYEKDAPDVLKGLSLSLHRGELLCILGGNGSGKSTMLSVLSCVRKPYRGKVNSDAVVGALPQDPKLLLVKSTLRDELLSVSGKQHTADIEKIEKIAALCRLDGLLDRHPYDLSGGEQQRAALAKLLLCQPEILLLDEPTKGLDSDFKIVFASVLKELTAAGVGILMVSHDVEFCAAYADRCGLFFDGSITALDAPQPFFAGKSFYTTAANRMSRHILPNAITPEDVILACGGKIQKREPPTPNPIDLTPPQERQPQKLPKWRKILAGFSAAAFLGLLIYITLTSDLTDLYRGTDYFTEYGLLYGFLFLSLALFALSIGRRASPREQRLMRGKLSKRTKVALLFSLLAIPATLWLSLQFGGNRKYMVVSLAIILETMLPFFLIFEGRKPQARELVILSVLSAMAIAGRTVFFALPGFKPVAAMVILTGVAFGGEAGFMVGAMTMFCSNILFGQGPWTPWQMFAMGIIGLLAGVLFRKGLLNRDRLSLSVFGGLSIFVIYGGILNPASVLMFQSQPNWKMILTSYFTGIPADAVHALATVLFLWILSEPMLEKLDRVKVKYGLCDF